MYARLRGTRYRIIARKLADKYGGECTSPELPNPTIKICTTIYEEEVLLENLIHEMTHAMQWQLSEKTVREFAADMTKVLLRLGTHIDVQAALKKLKGS
jgi:hypothetical protein